MASYLFPTEIKHENIMVESRSWEIEAGRKTTKMNGLGIRSGAPFQILTL